MVGNLYEKCVYIIFVRDCKLGIICYLNVNKIVFL